MSISSTVSELCSRAEACARAAVEQVWRAEYQAQAQEWREYGLRGRSGEDSPPPAVVADQQQYLDALFFVRTLGDAGATSIADTALQQIALLSHGSIPALPARCTVVGHRRSGRDAAVLTLSRPPDQPEYFRGEAGQHVAVHVTVNGLPLTRSYSLCRAPNESGVHAEISIGVRAHPNGSVSPHLVNTVGVGDTVLVSPPGGVMQARTRPMDCRSVLLIAAGSGITPLAAIAEAILTKEPRSSVGLVVVERTLEDVMLGELVAELGKQHPARFAFTVVATRSGGIVCRPTAATLTSAALSVAAQLRSTGFDSAYLCGPNAVASMATEAAEAIGIEPSNIEKESFGTGSMTAGRPRRGGTVQIQCDGAVTELNVKPGESILSAGLRTGVSIAFSCLAGSCGTCAVHVTRGAVAPTAPEVLGEKRTDDGWVLACQAAPA